MNASTASSVENSRRIAISGICLDMQTYSSLSQFLGSQPGACATGNLSQYIDSEREVARALEAATSRVCIVDLDANPVEANLVIERLQADYPDIFVFAVSASPDPDQIISAMRSGCTDFLTKPMRYEALDTALRRVKKKIKNLNKV